MEIFKKAALFGIFTLLNASNVNAMYHLRNLFFPLATASATYSILSFMRYDEYLDTKRQHVPFDLTPQQRSIIEKRFKKHKECTELTIVQMEKEHAHAGVNVDGSRCVLHLPVDFFTKDARVQKGVIAHEATHFSKDHGQKSDKMLTIALAGTALCSTLLPQFSHSKMLHYSSKLSAFFLLSYVTTQSLPLLLKKKSEKEADLLQKTPEELLGLLRSSMIPETADNRIQSLFSSQNRYLFASQILHNQAVPFLQKLSAPHPSLAQEWTYLADQFEKQILNPGVDDIPTSIEECKEALSSYFEKEEDYQTGTPNVDHPLVCKRVDFLRERLRWLQNTET